MLVHVWYDFASTLRMITGPKQLTDRAIYFALLFNIRPTIIFEYTSDETFSDCIQYEDGSFKIAIQDWVHEADLPAIIGHEMVHVWQYVRGSLEAIEETQIYIWEGKLYEHTEKMEEYFLRPWEMEARAMEEYCDWKWRHR